MTGATLFKGGICPPSDRACRLGVLPWPISLTGGGAPTANLTHRLPRAAVALPGLAAVLPGVAAALAVPSWHSQGGDTGAPVGPPFPSPKWKCRQSGGTPALSGVHVHPRVCLRIATDIYHAFTYMNVEAIFSFLCLHSALPVGL